MGLFERPKLFGCSVDQSWNGGTHTNTFVCLPPKQVEGNHGLPVEGHEPKYGKMERSSLCSWLERKLILDYRQSLKMADSSYS